MRRIDWTVRGRTLLAFCLISFAAQFLPQDTGAVPSLDDRQTYRSCRHCGMDRTQFAHSRLLIAYHDGSVAAVCSIHCAALDFAVNLSKPFRNVQVGDFNTRELIGADTAHWVLGGSKPGVMTRRAKWAFATKESAEAFVREHGGQLVTFSVALQAAYQDMYDFVMFRKKRAT